MKRHYHILFFLQLIILLMAPTANVRATHIVGGDATYVCLGANRYLIKLSIYRDCIGGTIGAISGDNPAYIRVFTGNNVIVDERELNAVNAAGFVIPPGFQNDCVTNPPRTCLNRLDFEFTLTLNASPVGYKVIYQDCCRNRSVLNIVNPFNTGATYTCTIPPNSIASCNSSAVFKNFPPQIICVNNPLVYDHSATDIDGDSLSYEFCQSYDSPEKQKKGYPNYFYDPVIYRSPFSFNIPMAGNPRIQIDPKTGLISGTPNLQGRFVVAVCCHEWRNGKIINTVTREFQFVVTNCSKAVIANIPQYSSEFNTYIVNCSDLTVKFENLSIGAMTYHWDFGVEEVTGDTSNAFMPTFTYPDSGTYVVTLYVNRGTTCSDSISRFVKVYPKLVSNFNAPSIACPGDTINFTDVSTSTYPIKQWIWNFDDNTELDYNQNARHVFPYSGLYNVGLITINNQGCLDTVFKKILIDPIKPNVGNDTVIVVGERINFKGQLNGNYKWMPSTYLSDPNVYNPKGTFTDTGTFTYIVAVESDGGCLGYDTLQIQVLANPYLAIPNIFSPNGDGKNDRFRPLLVGYQSLRYFRIYNRYGEEIFNTQNISDSWDGTYKGQDQEVGVYYWMIGLKDRFGKDYERKGDITLIR